MRPRRLSRRTSFALLTTAGLATLAGPAAAQDIPPPPPPVEVPTTIVTVPTTQPTYPPPSAPKPPPPEPTPIETPAPEKKDEGKDKKDEAETPYVNNDGTFRLSGSAGRAKGTGKGVAKGKGAMKHLEQGLVAEWPGFHLTSDGGSEVMVEFSKTLPAPTEHRAKGSITYVFKGAHITKSNNANPLITVHFNTPIAVAKLQPKGGDLQLVIELRAGVDAAPTTGMRAGSEGKGAQFFARFAPGHFVDEATDGDEVPANGKRAPKGEARDQRDKGGEKGAKQPEAPPTTSGPKTGPQP